MKHILLIEDDTSLQATISDRLRAELYTVSSISDGLTASTALQKETYDLIICDLMLPKKNGHEIICEFRKKNTETPVIVLTAKNTIADKVSLLRLGSNDYITKPFDFEELLARIEVLLRPHSPRKGDETASFCDTVFDTKDFIFDQFKIVFSQAALFYKSTEIAVSLLEFKILSYLVLHRNTVVTMQNLLDALWGESVAVGIGTVYTHISWLRKKLKTNDRPDGYIRTVRSVGYLFEYGG